MALAIFQHCEAEVGHASERLSSLTIEVEPGKHEGCVRVIRLNSRTQGRSRIPSQHLGYPGLRFQHPKPEVYGVYYYNARRWRRRAAVDDIDSRIQNLNSPERA